MTREEEINKIIDDLIDLGLIIIVEEPSENSQSLSD